MKQLVAAAVLSLSAIAYPAQAADRVWVTHGWAGYVIRNVGGSFAQVRGSWVQPRVVCNRPGSSVAFWLGLGGATESSRALEQIGTAADCSESGRLSYSVWFQLFPSPPVDVPLTLRAGDVVTAVVAVTGWIVTIDLRNESTGAAFSTELWMRYPETDTAEWIVEAPSACFVTCFDLPLAQFSRMHFLDASAAAETHTGSIGDSAWIRRRLEIADTRGKRRAVTGPLSEDGSSFAVVRHRE